MLRDRNGRSRISIARGILCSPIAEGHPVPTFTELTIPGNVLSPRVQEGVSGRTHDILS